MKNELTHLALIIDGNGRWATQRKLERTHGHKKGVEVAKQVITWAIEKDIPCLSFYVFSTENWKRSTLEIEGLFQIIYDFTTDSEFFSKNSVKVVVSGELDKLPQKLIDSTKCVTEQTKFNKKITVNLCLNYSGRQEIIQACNKLISRNEPITEQNILKNLYNDLPEPDLILRTGGQKRLSNFLLFQSSYAELAFSDTLWPDLSKDEFFKILDDYYVRKRNFGGI